MGAISDEINAQKDDQEAEGSGKDSPHWTRAARPPPPLDIVSFGRAVATSTRPSKIKLSMSKLRRRLHMGRQAIEGN